jgi:hypothetical protein
MSLQDPPYGLLPPYNVCGLGYDPRTGKALPVCEGFENHSRARLFR